MPSAFQTLTIIDISGLYSETLADRQRVADEIGQASRDSGFFYITGHPISRAVRDELLEATIAFFDRPLAEKMNNYIGKSTNHSGYVPQGEEVFYGQKPDSKEAFDISLDVPADDPEVVAGKTPFLGPVLWPKDERFKAAASTYYKEVATLARKMFCAFALSLGLEEDFFEEKLRRPASQLRLIHYPFNPNAPEDQPGIGAHTDYECFTILLPTAPGLEVMNGLGEWIDAPPIEDGFVINIGDMLEIFTNGEFTATSHRVRKVKTERYSFPYFASCDYHTIVEPLPQFTSDDNPPRYARLVAGDHLLAQTAQTFTYMKKRLEDGTFTLPDSSHGLSSFGQEARHRKAS